jgi:hypothetical protein
MLDGLRFDATLGKNGEKAGQDGADGNYVAPKSHIIVTTQTLFVAARPQGLVGKGHQERAAADRRGVEGREFLYPGGIERLRGGEFQFAAHRKAGRRDLRAWHAGGPNPVGHSDAADTVFVSAIANGKVYVAHGSIDPKVQVPACIAIRTSFNEKAEQAEDDLRFEKIDRKAYDKLGNLRQKGEDEYKRCFTQNAPKQRSFAEATRRAEKLLSAALNKR